ncbi:hypothetical protein D6829_01890 [Candidatus Pacearchaeota archaeon]|nr:MAG: hypothetical protein D6829_01890 [Candidatus Pacearchaeota archaeon]
MDALWHEVNEEEKEKIRKEARNLLENFSSKINRIKLKVEKKEAQLPREKGDGWQTPEEFREIFFANAPFVEDELIVAERGKWKR